MGESMRPGLVCVAVVYGSGGGQQWQGEEHRDRNKGDRRHGKLAFALSFTLERDASPLA